MGGRYAVGGRRWLRDGSSFGVLASLDVPIASLLTAEVSDLNTVQMMQMKARNALRH